ncbi:MAG: hypothetical protein Ta2G_17390 [Termitinemataceae bacterium]|nr:MAG: hypothetical protein Ta2G_17390 [Termitinemataceae bacterium]
MKDIEFLHIILRQKTKQYVYEKTYTETKECSAKENIYNILKEICMQPILKQEKDAQLFCLL